MPAASTGGKLPAVRTDRAALVSIHRRQPQPSWTISIVQKYKNARNACDLRSRSL
jgi:hypothetical protein